MLNNPEFRGVEFDPFLKEVGSNTFTMSPSRWVEFTNAVFINDGFSQSECLEKLNKIAISQMQVLENIEERRVLTDKK